MKNTTNTGGVGFNGTGHGCNDHTRASFLANNPDSRAAQASAWALLYSNAHDDSVRKLAIDNIIRLGGKIYQARDGAISIQLPQVD